MLLYHGSDHVIKRPEFGAGKKHNDYGRGFYCTENIELAKEWAVSEDADGYVNKYSIDTSRLSILDINSEQYKCSTGWGFYAGYFGGRMRVNHTLIIPDIIHPPAAPHSMTSLSRGTLRVESSPSLEAILIPPIA